jgi:hypothetical protein
MKEPNFLFRFLVFPHPVVIHVLLSPATIDEAIAARLIEKVSVQDALMMALRREP